MQGVVPVMFEIVAVGAMAMTFELRMPCFLILSRTGFQSMRPPRAHIDLHSALFFEQFDRVLRKQSAIPLRAAIARVRAALRGEVAGGAVRVERDGFHELVVELDRFLSGEAQGCA